MLVTLGEKARLKKQGGKMTSGEQMSLFRKSEGCET